MRFVDSPVAHRGVARHAREMRMDEAAVRRRREQNLAAARPDTRGIAPSIRNFAQAIDRQRQAIERVPVLAASRPDLSEAARGLDEAEVAALAIAVDDPPAELVALARAAQAVSVPVLRAELLPGEQLERLCGAARATHMAACVACGTPEEVQRAAAARAAAVALPRAGEALFAAVPRRILVLALDPAAAVRGRADALLDEAMGSAPDPAAAFRSALEED